SRVRCLIGALLRRLATRVVCDENTDLVRFSCRVPLRIWQTPAAASAVALLGKGSGATLAEAFNFLSSGALGTGILAEISRRRAGLDRKAFASLLTLV